MSTLEKRQTRLLSARDAAMARYAYGDESAFVIVYDALSPRTYGYLVRQTGDSTRAEDILQQTFLQIHRARGTFLPGAEVLPWAFAIARRLMIDSFRRGRREMLEELDVHNEPPATDPPADELVHAHEVAARIRRALSRLPESQRAAFELGGRRDSPWLRQPRSSERQLPRSSSERTELLKSSARSAVACSRTARAP